MWECLGRRKFQIDYPLGSHGIPDRARDLLRSHIHQLRVADIIYIELKTKSGYVAFAITALSAA
jgi:hypothetical protein